MAQSCSLGNDGGWGLQPLPASDSLISNVQVMAEGIRTPKIENKIQQNIVTSIMHLGLWIIGCLLKTMVEFSKVLVARPHPSLSQNFWASDLSIGDTLKLSKYLVSGKDQENLTYFKFGIASGW